MCLKIKIHTIQFYLFFLSTFSLFANTDTSFISVNENRVVINPGNKMWHFTATDANFSKSITKINFQKVTDKVPNFGINTDSHWLKFVIKNNSESNNIFLAIPNPIIDNILLFEGVEDSLYQINEGGTNRISTQKTIYSQNILFELPIKKGETKPFYLKINSGNQLLIPTIFGTKEKISEYNRLQDGLAGIYFGILLVILLYNLFIYLSIRDKSYLYYIIYVFFLGITQLTLLGYGKQFIWGESQWFSSNILYLSGALVGISTVFFSKNFLKTEFYTPRFHKLLNVYILLYLVAIVFALIGKHTISYNLINIVAGPGVIVLLYFSIVIGFKYNYRPAKFFTIAWGIFLVSVTLFVLKDYGIIQYNIISVYGLQIGSAIEVLLLSFALADKINILTQEKEKSQIEALNMAHENERLVKQQNTTLEEKVYERTLELKQSNENLYEALDTIKHAQANLVEAEKMASLGQLTAGIAHEINNPINFVSSNIKPLERDFEDLISIIEEYCKIKPGEDPKEIYEKVEKLKKQIDYDYLKEEIKILIKGIEDGAERTVTIVRGLRNFSRVDEQDLKIADPHEGLNSTLTLLNSQLNNNIEIIKEYGEIPVIECYPGKLNQVFMNILSNAIHAVSSIKTPGFQGNIIIKTFNKDNYIVIEIIDNGTGIPDHIKQRIFEPFFTTKNTGEGTGLGLSIVYNIIDSHKGTIEVDTEPNKGTTFRLTLPKKITYLLNGSEENTDS